MEWLRVPIITSVERMVLVIIIFDSIKIRVKFNDYCKRKNKKLMDAVKLVYLLGGDRTKLYSLFDFLLLWGVPENNGTRI